MIQFKNLSPKDTEELLKFPAYISLLAANFEGHLDEVEEKSAIKFSHIKTFSSDPLLSEFYKAADKVFKKNIEAIDRVLPKEKNSREAAIKKELQVLVKILSKLGKKYAATMHEGMESFKEHVSRAHNNVLVNFIFPIPIPGLTD
jgi:oligoendopeptidase F